MCGTLLILSSRKITTQSFVRVRRTTMKNFFAIQLFLLFLCVYIIGYSSLVEGEVHRIILKEEHKRPKRHKSHRHHRSHKHKNRHHHDHHRNRHNHKDHDDFKYRENDHSLENDSASDYSRSHEHGVESRYRYKDNQSQRPFRSNYHVPTMETRKKRQKHEYQNQPQQWTPIESLESSPSTRYGHTLRDYSSDSFSTVQNYPRHYTYNQKKIDISSTPLATSQTKPTTFSSNNNAYEVYENNSGRNNTSSSENLKKNSKTINNQNYQILSPLFHFDNQLFGGNNVSEISKNGNTIRKRRVVRRKKIVKNQTL